MHVSIVKQFEKILISFILFFSVSLHANEFQNKKLLCHTKNFGIKGGFDFVANNEVIRLNILLDLDNNKEVIKKTNHCYSIIGDNISLSRKGLSESCGRYNSFINIKSLEYSMSMNDYLLVAQCKYFTLSIEKELRKAIKSRSLKN
tara:strand:+ start:742 stop:1179 length:438 start_codon:yes stop_codon:yes gene_type:complete